MNKYFINLFLKENTVILPGFGALTALNGNLEDIMFLPYLKMDDGKLTNYIVETEGIDPQDAQNTVAKFIREMEVSLNKGESFDIYNFGSFFKNDEGEIEFKSAISNAIEEAQDSGEQEETKNPLVTPIFEVESTVQEEKEIETEIITVTSIKSNHTEESTIDFTPVEKEEIIEEKIPVSEIKHSESQNMDSIETIIPPKKKKFGFLFWILGILVLGGIGGGIYYVQFFKKDSISNPTSTFKEASPSDSTRSEEIEEPLDPTNQTVAPAEETKTPKEKKVESTEIPIVKTDISADTKGFYLIGGVYSSLTLAEKKAKKLQDEGLSPSILPLQNGSMYLSLGKFPDRKQASAELKTLREKGFKVWILAK